MITEILTRTSLTVEQAFICAMLYHEEKKLKLHNGKRPIELLYKYCNEHRNDIKNELRNLERIDFVSKIGSGGSENVIEIVDNYILTDKFLEFFFENTYIAGEELLKLYPSYIVINTNLVPLKKVDKYDLCERYCKAIDNSIDYHRKVMHITENAKKRHLLKMSLDNYVKSEQWIYLEELFENESSKEGYGQKRVT